MNRTLTPSMNALQDAYARRLIGQLERGSMALPHDITERLRVARVQALAQRKTVRMQMAASPVLSLGGGTAALGSGDEGLNLWSRLASALPLLVLVAGLVLIHVIQNDMRARELADVDAALLTDDLPPAAYADPGFVQYIKQSHETAR